MMAYLNTEFVDLTAPVPMRSLDGVESGELAKRLMLPRVELFQRVTSTLDVAHRLAREGAPAGTLVLAEEQTAGRGRSGRAWRSPAGSGLWLTMIERPNTSASVEVLSLRVGIHVAPLLDQFTAGSVGLKWPNDLQVGGAKLAGVLIEARWRGERPEYLAVGFGINVVPPAELKAAAVAPGVSRLDVLAAVVAGIRVAASRSGSLTGAERHEFAQRDVANGRRCLEPVKGICRGIDADGALLVEQPGRTVAVREGSLVLED